LRLNSSRSKLYSELNTFAIWDSITKGSKIVPRYLLW
jgi:hypothetical protein